MKLEAKQRLLATGYNRALAVRLWGAASDLFNKNAPPGCVFKPYKQLSQYDLYPRIGRFEIAAFKNTDLHLNPTGVKGSKLTAQIRLGVEESNEIHRANSAEVFKRKGLAPMKALAAGLKSVGHSCKLVVSKDPALAFKQPPFIELVLPLAALEEAGGSTTSGDLYAIKVTGQQGNSKLVTWNPNTGSKGPWSRDEALDNLPDIKEHMAYDDEFKRASFTVVKV